MLFHFHIAIFRELKRNSQWHPKVWNSQNRNLPLLQTSPGPCLSSKGAITSHLHRPVAVAPETLPLSHLWAENQESELRGKEERINVYESKMICPAIFHFISWAENLGGSSAPRFHLLIEKKYRSATDGIVTLIAHGNYYLTDVFLSCCKTTALKNITALVFLLSITLF